MATAAAVRRAPAAGARYRAWLALTRGALREARARTLGFAYLFAAVTYINPVSYRHAYPTVAERLGFAHSFAHNKAVVLFYGKAFDLLTVGGYTAWRSGGTLVIFAAVFGVLAAVRVSRATEDSGQAELVLATAVSRTTMLAAGGTAILLQAGMLWTAALAGLLAAGLPVGASAYLALAIVSVVPVFAGLGLLVSRLAPSRRIAVELGSGLVALALLLRVIADTSGSAAWLRWATPLGWAEEMRAFTGARPAVLLAALAASAVSGLWAARLGAASDVGTGLLEARDSADPRLRLLSSPTALALRLERGGVTVWLLATALFAFVVGVVSNSVSSAGISPQLRRTLARLGAGDVLRPAGYIGFAFIFFVLVVCLFAVAQVAAARHEEAGGVLDSLLSLPVGRRRWLAGRLGLALAGAAAIALTAGLLSWGGAVIQGVSVSFPRMLEAALNCLPVAILFLGLVALAYAIAPRAAVGLGYGLAVVAFLWQLTGSLLGAPKWLLDATPFAHVAAVPAQSLRVGAAGVMVAIGLTAAGAALLAFGRRDLTGA